MVNQGETLSLVCETTGDPTPVVRFLKDWEDLPASSRITVTSQNGVGRLSVQDFTRDDMGVYTCEATNSLGTRSAEPESVVGVDSVILQCYDSDLMQSFPLGFIYHKTIADPSGDACVEVVFLVDESGSMRFEQDWLRKTVPKLERQLLGIGVGAGALRNRYGLIGFGHEVVDLHLGPAAVIPVGDSPTSLMGNANQLVKALDQLHLDGSLEDGYAAMGIALDTYRFRSQCAIQFVLVTDEDRETFNETTSYSYTLDWLRRAGVTLNVVVQQKFKKDGEKPLGMDFRTNAFIQDGKTYNKMAGGTIGAGYEDTYEQYVKMAFATDGAAWDLNRLRAKGSTATAFTEAFLDIKVQEIQTRLRRCSRCMCESEREPTCRITNIPPADCPEGQNRFEQSRCWTVCKQGETYVYCQAQYQLDEQADGIRKHLEGQTN